MPLFIALGALGVLLLFFFWAMTKEEPPAPEDVAIAYEMAWDRLDFSLMFDVCGSELREGMRRDGFIQMKRKAYGDHPAHRIGAQIEVETSVLGDDTALVITRVSTPESSVPNSWVRNNVLLEKRGGSWAVVGYNLRPEPEPERSPNS
jgi:hypothetical protein